MNINQKQIGSPHYLFGLGLFFLLSTILLFLKTKAESFLFLNSYHTEILDAFFYRYTFLGDGLFAVLLSVVLFFFLKTQRLSIELLVSFIVSGLLAQLFKNIFKHPRPSAFFTPDQYPYFFKGLSINNHVSFPSGHTTTAFAVTFILASYTKNKMLQILLLILAILAGYSRIYLAQHFLEDVLAGAILGSAISAICLYYSGKVKPQKHIRLIKKGQS
jgi:membrane-associated phospholipid phosphatase